jgi:hypothetical protein
MDTLLLITRMFGLVALGALIWLTIRAFKTKPGWGFAVLLLSPFSAAVFGVKYWEEQREPFLLYIATFTATFALCVYLFAVSGGLELLGMTASSQRGMQTQTGTSHDSFMHASYSVGETPGFTDEPVIEEIAAIEDEPVTKEEEPVRYRLTYVPIKLTEVKNYIGATAKITRKNAREKEYLITGASPRHIEIAQRGKGGKFSFHLKNSDIKNIRVLVNETY